MVLLSVQIPPTNAILTAGESVASAAVPWCIATVMAGWLVWRQWREQKLIHKLRESEALLRDATAPIIDNGAVLDAIGTSIAVTRPAEFADAKHESERRFRALVEHSAEAVALFNARGEILYASLSSTRILGYPFPKFIGYNAFQLVHAEDRDFVAHQLEQSLKRPSGGVPLQTRVHHHNGSWRLVEGTLTNLLDDPDVAAIVFNFRDITERTMAQRALRESEARFQAFMDHSPAVIYMKDSAGRYLQINRKFEKVFGLTRAEIIGRKDEELFSAAQSHQFRSNDRKTMDADRTVEFEETPLYVDGPHITLAQRFPLHDGSGQITAICGIATDITERRQLEQQLRQAQRMESIGQLAGGIAHDFNNLLTVIQGHASLIEETEGMSTDVMECLEQISAASEQASNLTRQLLTFSRRQTIRPQTLELNVIVDGMTKMLRRTLGENVRLQSRLAPSLPPIHADSGMIEQVLLNLAINARDAMPAGGDLVITTEQRAPGLNEYPLESGAPVGSCVCLTVSDTGSGIEPQDLPRIFEPFFTTKAVGKGTGLGLATVYGVVRQHRGWIDVKSEPGHGTTFDVFLPVAPENISDKTEEETTAETNGGHETILIVEDEDPLRRLMRAILERNGYRVLEAVSGVAALKIWEQRRGAIDLILTDIIMPEGLDGCGLATRLRSENADVKILFTSGYSEDTAGSKIPLHEGVNFLPKPFHPLKLIHIVRQVLDSGKKVTSA